MDRGSFTYSFAAGFNSGSLVKSEVRSSVGNHEIAIMDFHEYPKANAPTEGSQVALTYGTRRWGKTFYGYVNHVESVRANGARPIDRMFCVGTSLPMNNVSPQSWNHLTGSAIARRMAERHGLRSVISRSKEVLSTWTQGSHETDFAMMNRLADRCGRMFWVSGATLFFIDPMDYITRANVDRVYRYHRGRALTIDHLDDTLMDVWTVEGSLAPGGGGSENVIAYGLDASSGKGVVFKDSSMRHTKAAGLPLPLRSTISSTTPSSAHEAARLVESASTGNWATMDAVVRPVWPVSVGSVIDLTGDSLAPSSRGLWLVSGVIDVCDREDTGSRMKPLPEMVSRLQLTRNALGTHKFNSTKFLTAPAIVPAVWQCDRWQARFLESLDV